MSDNPYPFGKPKRVIEEEQRNEPLDEYAQAREDFKNWEPHPTNPQLMRHKITGKLKTKDFSTVSGNIPTPVTKPNDPWPFNKGNNVQGELDFGDEDEFDTFLTGYNHELDVYCFNAGIRIIAEEY